ncbi:MAG TPA: hypothetical protein VGN82_25845 [Bosea sp. (in: a-proteobacteria)]|jgi:hypothetical protein|uniref:hypothetical protein n=1 Tax=Bosea sp. (in: a-proteobacteria) TaxID=1871050 RepID=UPI002E0D3559|nr:hypothetical protein [Bosea sp. (in: a-proteobacteria)]
MRSLALGGLALALLGIAQPAPAQNRPATCSRDLFQNEAGLRRQQSRLTAVASADQATQCRTWREHVGFLQNARSIFATCQSGNERAQNVALMDSELADYRALLANRCGGKR